MNAPRDGQRVSYVGPDSAGRALGDRAVVLSADHLSSHVMWTSGASVDEIDLIDNEDLAPVSAQASVVASPLDDSLEYGSLISMGVRETYDEAGPAGLLNALAESGHLTTLALVAEEALTFVAGRIRSDASIRAVLGQLEPEEADSLVLLAAECIMRDTFGEDS